MKRFRGEEEWYDNSSLVMNRIASLYAEKLMSDVILVVGNDEYPSHRLILCASSDVFQVMLLNPNWSESYETKIYLGETVECAAVFEIFLKYLYTGKIFLDYSTVIPIVSLADKYNVKDLLLLGLEFMSRNISTACKKNTIVSWYGFLAHSAHKTVARSCHNFIKWNFKAVSQTIDFSNMEPEYLFEFLQCSDLVIEDEMTLFKCVYAWLIGRKDNLEMRGEENIEYIIDSLVSLLIPEIRFSMMTPCQLADLLLNSLSKTELLIEKMREAMNFHKNPSAVFSELKLITPRLYTAERFCASLSVNNLRTKPSYYSLGLSFNSQKYMADHLQSKGESLEWFVDILPKGVWFQKCLTVYKPPQLEVPERVYKTVRVSLRTNSKDVIRVCIGILVFGIQDGFEHVRHVRTRNYIFSANDQIVNFDDLVDYDELNHIKTKSPFLTGSNREKFKVNIVVIPIPKIF